MDNDKKNDKEFVNISQKDTRVSLTDSGSPRVNSLIDTASPSSGCSEQVVGGEGKNESGAKLKDTVKNQSKIPSFEETLRAGGFKIYKNSELHLSQEQLERDFNKSRNILCSIFSSL